MKVVFKSPKENEPGNDQGIQVLYGPGKRVAFKARWYFIVFLVSSPLIWLAWSVISSVLLVESSGKLVVPAREIFSQEQGQVTDLNVSAGEKIIEDQLLFTLSNPDIVQGLERQKILADELATPNQTLDSGLAALERAVADSVAESGRWRAKIKQYMDAGITTESELQTATEKLLEANRQLAEVKVRRDEWKRLQASGKQSNVTQADLALAQSKLDALSIRSPESGLLADIYVKKGQWVQQGEPVARLKMSGQLQVWLYIDPKYADYAREGESLSLILPNGEKHAAHIVKGADRALKLPTELRLAFSGNNPGLLAMAEFEDTLDQNWHIDQLPMTARFTPKPIQWLFNLF